VFGPLTYLALGSNLDRPHLQLKRATRALSALPYCQLVACSSVYRSAPVGPGAQAHYLNAVLAVRTSLPARTLLKRCQTIERQLGRKRRKRWGPRTLDIDIIWHQHKVVRQPGLRIPHPRMTERDFVVFPLLELAPNLVLSGNRTLAEVASSLRKDQSELPANGMNKVPEKITITKLSLRS